MRDRTIARLVRGVLAGGVVTASSVMALAQAPATPAPSAPPAILKAFQQAYPGATITATAQQRDTDRTVFRVEGVDQGRRRIVLYGPSGTVIETAEQVAESQLPPPVAAAMHSHPRAIYVAGLKVARGGSVHYQLTLRGTRKTAMVVKPDGTVVSFQ